VRSSSVLAATAEQRLGIRALTLAEWIRTLPPRT
jgi:hypothetical protein